MTKINNVDLNIFFVKLSMTYHMQKKSQKEGEKIINETKTSHFTTSSHLRPHPELVKTLCTSKFPPEDNAVKE